MQKANAMSAYLAKKSLLGYRLCSYEITQERELGAGDVFIISGVSSNLTQKIRGNFILIGYWKLTTTYSTHHGR